MSTIGINLNTSKDLTNLSGTVKPIKAETPEPESPAKIDKDNISIKTVAGAVPVSKALGGKGIPSFVPKIIIEIGEASLNVFVKKDTKTAIVASEKILENGAKVATKTVGAKAFIGKAMPMAVTTINVGVTLLDGYDAYKKIKDENISIKSKGFALGTVALDLFTIAAFQTGKGKLAGAAAFASIGTSIASDLLKHK